MTKAYSKIKRCSDSLGSICQLVIQRDLPKHGLYLNHSEKLLDVLEKTLCTGVSLPSSVKDVGEKWMQLLMEIHVATLLKITETMQMQMSATNKAEMWNEKWSSLIYINRQNANNTVWV